MTKQNNLTTKELLHVLTDIMFACREKWGDEIFIKFWGHIDNIDIEICQGKWKYDDSNLRISFNTYVNTYYNNILEDLDIYYEQGFDYFLNNNKSYWYKKQGGHDD